MRDREASSSPSQAPAPSHSESVAFGEHFGRWAGRVRRRLALGRSLTGATLGLLVGAAAATALWKTGHGQLRPWATSAGVLGAAAGLALAHRKRWADAHVALYLDGRLGSGELVSTALELGKSERDSEATGVVLSQATEVLRAGDPKRVRPPVLAPWHLVMPLSIAAIAYFSWLPLPKADVIAAPGADKVTLAEVKGLEKAAALGALKTPDPEQRKRLDQIARDAASLREKLKDGVERREALAEIARLQDAVQQERLSLGDGERRAGLEAALSRLAENPLTRDAAKALGDRDLVKFDEEMQRLANEREKADREQAKQALAEAAEAARKAKAEDVARALERQRELLDKRGQRADELRELQDALKDALGDGQSQGGDEQGQQGSPSSDKDARRLAQAFQDALKNLTPEERKRLAENLKKRLQERSGSMSPGAEADLRDMLRKLETEEGKRALEDHLRELAEESTEDDEADRQGELGDAERGLGEAQGELGGVPMPMPGAGSPGPRGQKGAGNQPGKGGDQPGKGGGGNQPGQSGTGSGSGHDSGTADHKGRSQDVQADELRARAHAKLDGKAPTAGITIGRTAGQTGETANVQGTGALGVTGPAEVGAVDKSEVPEEYREQVGRYFQP